jgi:hypothetical protein
VDVSMTLLTDKVEGFKDFSMQYLPTYDDADFNTPPGYLLALYVSAFINVSLAVLLSFSSLPS